MRKPDLEKIQAKLLKGDSFELSEQQYRTQTGADFPKNLYYARNNSAVARKAKEYGYTLEIQPKKIRFVKIEKGAL